MLHPRTDISGWKSLPARTTAHFTRDCRHVGHNRTAGHMFTSPRLTAEGSSAIIFSSFLSEGIRWVGCRAQQESSIRTPLLPKGQRMEERTRPRSSVPKGKTNRFQSSIAIPCGDQLLCQRQLPNCMPNWTADLSLVANHRRSKI